MTEDQRRKQVAIDLFVSMFNGSYQKLGVDDIDYKVFDSNGNIIAYVDVSTRYRTIRDAYPLSLSAKRAIKLTDKRLNPIAIWSCEDGIVYGNISNMSGDVMFSDDEFIFYFEKQKPVKYVRFHKQKPHGK